MGKPRHSLSKAACAHREFSQTTHKARDSLLPFDSSACLSPSVAGLPTGGGGELVRANPWNWCPAPSEDRRAQAPGLCVPRWDRLHLGEAQELAHLSQPTAWELQGGRKGAGLGDRARPTEMCVHFSCWHDRLLGSL